MTDRTTHRQVVYRLLPGSRAKARRLAALAGACRFVWNEMLDQQEQLYAIARMQGGEASGADVLHPRQGLHPAPPKPPRRKSPPSRGGGGLGD
ncbi:MAG: helix-turn-helix domain-containing protein [Defluviicoccus sp.]|nr:helix-turn-helix domain-containing protein [Defluviicoccus sp.]